MSRDKPATQHLRVLLPSDGSTDMLEQMFSRFPGFRRSSARIKRGQRTGAAPAGGGGRGPPPDRASYRDDRQPYGGGGAGGAPPQSNPYASLSYDPAAASRYEPGPVGGYAGGRRDEPYRGRDRPRDEWRRDGPRDGGRDGRREPPPAPRGREPRREDGPPRRWLGTKPRMPAALPIPEGDALKAPSAVLYAANLPTDASEREISHIFRGFHGFKEVSMRFKNRDEKLYREDRANRPVTFIHFDTLEDATAALQARQGYVVDPADADNTRLALNYSSKFNPDNAKTEGKDEAAAKAAGPAEPASEGAEVAGDAAPAGQAEGDAVTTPVADVKDDAEADDATDVQLDSAEAASPAAAAAQPAATDSALNAEASETANDVLDFDEDEDA